MNDEKISDEEIRQIEMAEEQIHAAMAKLPDELTAEYREACRFVPELVERESDPRWFLSFHPNDPLAAARRLANYWKKRKEIFKERAFLPIDLSGNGAMTSDDVKLLRTGYTVNLPRDTKGRSVIYSDSSKKPPEMIPSLRMMFFFGQCLMENEMSRKDGFVIIWNISNPFAANFNKVNNECSKALFASCMPARARKVHLLHIAPQGMNFMPLFLNTVFTWAVNYLGSYFGKSIAIHVASSKEDCLAHLLKYDFSPEGLPVSLGGSWTGGCEPWRRKGSPNGSAELSLEIETDLSCMFRTVLWLHSQAVAARTSQQSCCSLEESHHQNGQTEASDTVNEPHYGEDSKMAPHNEAAGPMNDESHDEDSKMLSASSTTAATSTATTATKQTTTTASKPRGRCTKVAAAASAQQAKTRAKSVDIAKSRCKYKSAAPRQPKARAKSLERTSGSPTAAAVLVTTTHETTTGMNSGGVGVAGQPEECSSRISFPAATLPRAKQPVEELHFRRKRDAVYAQRKRERKRIEVEELQKQELHLSAWNEVLRSEAERLEALLRTAQEEIQRRAG